MSTYARQSDSFCVRTESPALLPRESDLPGGGQRIVLVASVGRGGVNRREDTRKVQDALNRVPKAHGGAHPPLVPDGLIGPKTIGAIQNYQLKHFGFKGADGRVDPNKRTIAKLNEDSGALTFPDLTGAVKRTRSWVLECLRHLDVVATALHEQEPAAGEPFRPQIGSRAQKMRLVNKHFDLDVFPNKQEMFLLIRRMFESMRMVFERPGGLWGAATFDRDPLNLALQAYAVGGGFFHPGRTVFIDGTPIRADAIYLCVRFANELHDDSRRAFVMIHELAHFVGHPQPVGDHAHNKQGNKIRTMPSNLKLINAETYANFAWEVANGFEAPVF